MSQNFSDFNIAVERRSFSGDKLQINDILNVKIEVIDYVIEPSTAKPGTNRIKLHFKLGDKFHICFFGSTIMQEQIKKVQKSGFPFFTTIVLQSREMKFT